MGMEDNMHERENYRRRIRDLGAIMILIGTAAFLLLSGKVLNPFYVVKPEKDKDIQEAYERGVDYVELNHVNLEFSGYYKLDKKEQVKYNCYTVCFDQKDYFVFISVNPGEIEDIPVELKEYSFVGRLKEEEELFQMVAKDYQISTQEFQDAYEVSPIVFDTTGSKHKEMLIIWMVLFCMLSSYSVYLCAVILEERRILKMGKVENLRF